MITDFVSANEITAVFKVCIVYNGPLVKTTF